MITIELDIFSGRPNPLWTLTNKEENELFSRVMADKDMSAPPRKVGHLGYRGFGIKVGGERANRWHAAGIPPSFFISAGHQRGGETETFLLNTANAGQTAADEVLKVAQEYIDAANYAWTQRWIQAEHAENGPPLTPANRHEPLIDGTIIVPDPDGRGTPSSEEEQINGKAASDSASALACGAFSYTSDTNFTYWNSDPYVMQNNNCYNFAANYRSDTFAQPGRKANVEWYELACGNSPGQIGYAASSTGLISTAGRAHSITPRWSSGRIRPTRYQAISTGIASAPTATGATNPAKPLRETTTTAATGLPTLIPVIVGHTRSSAPTGISQPITLCADPACK